MSALYSAYDTLCSIDCLKRHYFHSAGFVFELIDTDYFLELGTDVKITCLKRHPLNFEPPSEVSFEEVLNAVPPEFRERFLFHLDLFI